VKLVDLGQGPQPQEALFETFAAKKGFLINASAFSSTSVPGDVQRLQFCRLNPASLGCDAPTQAEALRHLRDWASAVLAVHLATFRIG
jgi:hypothetical protein